MDAKQRKIQSLTDQLKSLRMSGTAPKTKRARKNKRKNGAQSTPGAIGSVSMPGPSGQQKQPPGGAMVRFSRREMVYSIKTANNGELISHLDLNPANFGWVAGLSKSFERYRFTSLKLYYKPAVGSVLAGVVSLGVDYSSTKDVETREHILQLTPSQSFPVWQDTESRPLTVPQVMLQSRKWYTLGTTDVTDKQTGRLIIYANSNKNLTLGDLWVLYTIEFAGTVFQ